MENDNPLFYKIDLYQQSYSNRQQLIRYLRLGDVDSLKRMYEDPNCKESFINMMDDDFEYGQDMQISGLAILSKCASEIGLSIVQIETLNKRFRQAIHRAHTNEELWKVATEMTLAFVTAIHLSLQSQTVNTLPLIKKCIQYVKDEIYDNISIDQLAKNLDVSTSYLSRIFKQQTGETLNMFITKEKIIRARVLLENTDLTLAEISYKLGFSSQSYFTYVFRKYVGTTPGNYREQYENTIR